MRQTNNTQTTSKGQKMTAINSQLAARLEQFKAWKAAKNSTEYREVFPGALHAVDSRGHTANKPLVRKPKNPLLKSPMFDFPSPGSDSHGKIAWVSGSWKNCLRNAQAADYVNSRLPRGYYVDQYQDETVSGFVVQLPGHKQTERWLAGTTWSDSDMSKIHLDEILDSAEDAARRADQLAEKLAEDEREYRENEEERAKEAAKADAAKKLAEIEFAAGAFAKAAEFAAKSDWFAHLPEYLQRFGCLLPEEVARLMAGMATLKKLCDEGNIDVTNDWQEFRD